MTNMAEHSANERDRSTSTTSLLNLFSPSTQIASRDVSRFVNENDSVEIEGATNESDSLSITPPTQQSTEFFLAKHLGHSNIELSRPLLPQANNDDHQFASSDPNGHFLITPKFDHRKKTTTLSSLFDVKNESKSPERMPLLVGNSPLRGIFQLERTDNAPALVGYETMMSNGVSAISSEKNQRKHQLTFATNEFPILPPIREESRKAVETKSSFGLHYIQKIKATATSCCQQITEPSTWIGAFMFLLFHNVYCLTIGAAIIRPHGPSSIVGQVTKMASLGIILGSEIFWLKLRKEIPALYPSVDCFAAPFLANIAAVVDNALFNDSNVMREDNDEYFFATFGFLLSLSLIISGTLLILASYFKLANVGVRFSKYML